MPRPITVTSAPAISTRRCAAVPRSARGARQRPPLAEDQVAEVDRVQPVRVLGRVHPAQHPVRVQARRERKLDDVPGASGVGVQFIDNGLDLLLGRVGGQIAANARDPDLGAVPVLAVHVGPAARVVADQDSAQPGHDPAFGQDRDPFPECAADLGRRGLAVQDLRGHRLSAFRFIECSLARASLWALRVSGRNGGPR
jgi:hypothetical protein